MESQNAEYERFDAIVIGAGQAALPLAAALGRAGWKTAVVERKHAGGSCVNFGCTPTKAMAASARVAHLARCAGDYGVRTDRVEIDLAGMLRRKNAIVDRFREGLEKAFDDADNVEFIFGHATFVAPHALAVRMNAGGNRRLAADHIFINTGTRAAIPPIPGLDQVQLLDASSILKMETLPRHLMIIGGSYIGLEFGQMFRRFGSEVSIIQRGPQLLPREDPDVAEAVQAILTEDGIKIHLEADVLEARPEDDGAMATLRLRLPSATIQLTGSHVLVAIGRHPNSDDLGLEAAGVKTDDAGYVVVNERLMTNVPGVYAMGDVKGGPQFTHIAYDDHRVLKANLLEQGSETVSGRSVPYVLYIDPQLGRVGLGEEQAKSEGRRILVARLPMRSVARAVETGETRGFVKAIIDADTGRILGGAVLGAEGGELMSMLQLAIMGDISFHRLRDAVFAHPAFAESLNSLFAAPQAPQAG